MKLTDLLNKSSLIIGEAAYTIKQVNSISNTENKNTVCQGRYFSKKDLILLRKRNSFGMLSTLIHEILHVLDLEEDPLFDVYDAEPVINRLAQHLTHFLIDNKIIEVNNDV